MRRLAFLIATAIGLSSALAADPTFDLVIRHGRVVDGTGNPSVHADVAITAGKIAAIGKIEGTGRSELDAGGLVVAPGFIDVHTHAEDIDDQPRGENFLRMGVTTLVLGNCGGSALNIGEYFARLEAEGISPNVATLVGHGTVRRRAMHGSFDRPPTEAELTEMRDLTRRGMEDGAVGMSTVSFTFLASLRRRKRSSSLAKVVGEYGGIYATHQRSEGREIFQSLEEIFRIARQAGVRADVSHIKLSGPANWNQADKVLAAIEHARSEGLDITQDQYGYTASSTGISQLIPQGFREGGQAKFLERLANAEAKAAVVAEMKSDLKNRKSEDYSYAVIASFRANPACNGKNIVEAAQLERGSATLDDQIETILNIETRGGATGVFHGMSEEDLQVFMRHPNTMFASDSGVRRFQVDVPHPRGYGNNARILGRYVREKKVLRLEDAVRRMTSLPAKTYQLQGRGEIAVGACADLAVFDPETVSDPSTFSDPHHYAIGFRWVIVNGQVVVESDQHNGAKPGQIVRRAGTKPWPVHADSPAEAGPGGK